MSVQAVIEFVGIIVMATAPATTTRPTVGTRPPANAGVIAIIPRVTLSQVPTHTAAIIYRTSSGTLGGHWVGKSVPIRQGAWSYLPLDGDQLTFITGLAPTKPPSRPDTLDRLRHDWETFNAGVPKLDLDAGYTAARHYANAAAVARLTDGSLNGCHSQNHQGRTETTAKVETNGVLTIVSNRFINGSTSQWGTLRLDITQSSTLAIVNLPTGDVDGTMSMAGNHYLAYCAMANQSINCPVPIANPPDPCPSIDIPLPEFAPPTMTSSATRLMTQTPVFRVTRGRNGARTVVAAQPTKLAPNQKVQQHAMSADCSNTSWP